MEELNKIGQAILDAIRTLAIAHEKSKITDIVTMSIGGTVIKLNLDIGNSEDLIKVADNLLYQSKQNGRNTMTIKAMS